MSITNSIELVSKVVIFVQNGFAMKGIIVDDEAKSRRMLRSLCQEFCDGLEIIGMAASISEAKKIIDEKQPDIVFLDIKMPVESGFALLDFYKGEIPFNIIFTTAFDQYAVQAFKYTAIDYLLKPIDIDALIHAIEKAQKNKGLEKYSERYTLLKEALAKQTINKIALTTQDGLTFVRYEEIIRCEAEGNYTSFHLVDGSSLLITKTLRYYEELLLGKKFFRVHKSHLINLNYVRKFIKGKQGLIETTDGATIEVSLRKREALLKELAALE